VGFERSVWWVGQAVAVFHPLAVRVIPSTPRRAILPTPGSGQANQAPRM
jgi:hypothetical protein